MLVTYHRVYDSKLLLVCVPAAALLWAKRGVVGWAALIITSAAIFFSADLPLAVLGIFLKRLHLDLSTISGQILTALIERPSQEALLLMSLFFLWVYLRKDISNAAAIDYSESPVLDESSGISDRIRA
jgi:hypothetical protein